MPATEAGKFSEGLPVDVPRAGDARRQRIHVVVLIDALGWKFLEDLEFLSDILPYRVPLRTVLGFSSGAIPTILTGLPPSETGHWNLFYLDRAGSPFRWLRYFSFLPQPVLDSRVTRKLLKELGRRVLGMGPNFECCVSPRFLPWFNYVERRDIYKPAGIAQAKSIFDRLAEKGAPYRVYTYHEWNDDEILRRALRDIKAGDAQFYFVYLCEMDLLLHNQWANPQPLEQKLAWYAGRLRELFEAARQNDAGASFFITSDHGMTPVREHYDVARDVESLRLSMPGDYLAVYDSTMARFWFSSERGRTSIVSLLETLECGRVLSDDELRQLGILFPDRRYGETIFLLHPGWLITASDFNGPGWVPAGMHGYHPDDPYSDAVFLSDRKPSTPVRTIADVYRIMEEAIA